MILEMTLAPLVEQMFRKAFMTIKRARKFTAGEISFYYRIYRSLVSLAYFLTASVSCASGIFIGPRKVKTPKLILKYPLYHILTLFSYSHARDSIYRAYPFISVYRLLSCSYPHGTG